MDRLEKRLDRLESKRDEDHDLLLTIRDKVNQINGDLVDVIREIGGVRGEAFASGEKPIRTRLHDLEKTGWAETMLREARAANVNAQKAAWSTREKAGLFLFAAGAFTISLLRILGVGG